MNNNNIAFINKVISILENPTYQDAIAWSETGKYLEIRDESKLELEVLEKEFKHNKIGSFIRQLNMYGFKKMKNTKYLSFIHQHFQKGNTDGLLNIKRRKNCKETERLERERKENQLLTKLKQNQKQQAIIRIQQQLKKPVALPPFLCPFDINQFSYLPEFPMVMKSIQHNWFQQFTKFVGNFQ